MIDGLCNNSRQIGDGHERHDGVFVPIYDNRSLALEIEYRLQGLQVGGYLVGKSQVVEKQTWLQEGVLEGLGILVERHYLETHRGKTLTLSFATSSRYSLMFCLPIDRGISVVFLLVLDSTWYSSIQLEVLCGVSRLSYSLGAKRLTPASIAAAMRFFCDCSAGSKRV